MNILFLTNSSVSEPLIHWLSERESVTILKREISTNDIRTIKPDRVISYSYRHIIKPAVLDSLPDKFLNLHISLLPFNRGADPNAWSFLDDTPKGVSIHLIDKGIDTGPILCQREVVFNEEKETLNSTYNALQHHIKDLFINNWSIIKSGQLKPTPQSAPGTYHSSKELAELKEQFINKEDWTMTIQQFKENHQQLKISNTNKQTTRIT